MKLVDSNDPILRSILAEVPDQSDVSYIIGEMSDVIRTYGGAGLAANQIGYDKRIILIKCNGFKMAIINPVILRKYGGTVMSNESCLSFRGEKSIRKLRHRRVEIEGFNKQWEPIKFKLKGFPAVVVQHEVDHLNGITII